MDASVRTSGSSRAAVASSSHPLAPPPRKPLAGASWQPSQLNRRRNVANVDDGHQAQRPATSRQGSYSNGNVIPANGTADYDDEDARKKAKAPEAYGGTPLQRIEGWFGISGAPATSASAGSAFVPGSSFVPGRRRASGDDASRPSSSALSSSPSHAKSKVASSLPSSMSKSVTTLVLLHPVSPATTLDSIALQYGVEVAVLRRANGLWPGDSIQARRDILVPLDKCTRGVPEEFTRGADGGGAGHEAAAAGVGQLRALGFKARDAVEGQGGKLYLSGGDSSVASSVAGDSPSMATLAPSSLGLHRPNLHRAASNASFSSSRQASNSVSGGAPSNAAPRVKLMPSDALSYFPPPADAKSGKGKGRSIDLLEGSDGDATRMAAAAVRADPGESGVDDLLVLARKAREVGTEVTSGDDADAEADASSRPGLGIDAKAEDDASGPDEVEEEPWKPNKWTFGASRSGKGASTHERTGSASNEENSTSSSGLATVGGTGRGPAMLPLAGAPPSSSSSSSAGERTPGSGGYNGWNDAPEPPLSRTAKGKVAHAYKGRAARAYHGTGGGGPLIPGLGATGTSILEDLTASTLPNSGAASNWARPISESVPVPGNAKSPSITTTSGAGGWGKLFSDTLRGRIGLDEAMSRAANEVAATFEAPAPEGINGAGYYAGARGPRAGGARTVGRAGGPSQGPRLAQMRREAHLNGGSTGSGLASTASAATSNTSASASPPARPSAELASAALAGNRHRGAQDVASEGELRDLTVADRGGAHLAGRGRYDTWADGTPQPSPTGATGKARSRGGVRKIDWTASEG